MLRSLFVIGLLLIGFRYAITGPFPALLLYLWLGYFRPEQWLWWDFISSLRISYLVGAWILLSMVFARDRFVFGLGPAFLALFVALAGLSTLFSPVSDLAWPYFVEFTKLIIICYLMLSLVTTEQRLRMVLITIAFSLAFEGAKQGWAELILHPGAHNDNTHPVLGDNNGVAVGMFMLTALLLTLGATATWKVEGWLHRFLAFGTLYRGLSTYSRGGFLGCGVLALVYFVRSKRKVHTLAAMVVVGAVLVPVLPDAFWDRMGTIPLSTHTDSVVMGTEEFDASIASRLHFWSVAVSMAEDHPFLGIGHNAYNFMYDAYDTSHGLAGTGRSVHSAWFGVMAEWGFIGFVMYVALMLGAILNAGRVRRLARLGPQFAALAGYATAIEVGLAVFAVSGSFVPFQYNEMVWHFVTLSIVVGRLADQRVLAEEPSPETNAIAPALVRDVAL